MTLWTAFRQSYVEAWRFIIALPFIAAAVIGFEGLQHVLEWLSGMYRSFAGFRAAAHDPGRMISGSLKIGSIILVQYWIARFLVSTSIRKTLAFDLIAIRKFGWYFLFIFALALSNIFVPEFLPEAGTTRRAVSTFLLVVAVATFPIGVILIPWGVSAALGDNRASPVFAWGRATGSILWGAALIVLAPLPLMAAHYALGYGAVGRAPHVAIPMLILDALLVSFLSIVVNTSQILVADRMARRTGDRLECNVSFGTTVASTAAE
jgi:hypothetical protein